MDKVVITYAQRSDATPEAEISALANVYRFVLNCHTKEAAPDSRPDVRKENPNASDKSSIPRAS